MNLQGHHDDGPLEAALNKQDPNNQIFETKTTKI
jgi:hypothetical protein